MKSCYTTMQNKSRVIGRLCPFVVLFFLSGWTQSALSQTEWLKYDGNPVLYIGPAGSWDDRGVYAPSVLFDGNTYRMWYSGAGVGAPRTSRTGYATSTDGLNWTKYSGNPVLDVGPSGSWDDARARGAVVLYNESTYKMWYAGSDGFNRRIGYATSADGITWTKYAGNPVLDIGSPGSWDDWHVKWHWVLFDGTGYHMWYTGQIWGDWSWRIGYATSPDGINWTKYPNNPVLDVGELGSWDDAGVGDPSILFDGTTYHMWYSGYNWQGNWRAGYATSPDGINWTRFPGNPVLDLGEPGSWDDNEVGCPLVMFIDNYKMWYDAGNGVNYGIGYATTPQGAIQDIIAKVEDLVTAGVLNQGQGNALIVKLEGAIAKLNQGRTNAAINKLRAFINQVNAFMRSGVFTLEEGQPLISAANRIIDYLNGLVKPIVAGGVKLPDSYALYDNYPNPFNPETRIDYALPEAGYTRLMVYDILGRKVARLVDGHKEAGYHAAEWNAAGISSGVYFYQLRAGDFIKTRKMVLIR